jgi:arylsulfatase A-like enzyme
VNTDDWRVERWKGYETDALLRYAVEFMDHEQPEPFCLFVSPHQPHGTPLVHAPEEYYRRLPGKLSLPANVPEHAREEAGAMYRHYLAMTLAVDDMVGGLLAHLEKSGRAADTLVIFTSDHGTEAGAHPEEFSMPVRYSAWQKCMPHEEAMRVPLVLRLPGVLEGGRRSDTLVSMVDLFPSLCGIMGMPKPRTLEGHDLSDALTGKTGAFERDAVLTMNFTASFDYLKDGREWRGVRTKRHSYDRWLDGKTHLYDITADPLEQRNLAGTPGVAELQADLEAVLHRLLVERGDTFPACHEYAGWFDEQRRVVRNARGPLGNPEVPPDWSLFDRSG